MSVGSRVRSPKPGPPLPSPLLPPRRRVVVGKGSSEDSTDVDAGSSSEGEEGSADDAGAGGREKMVVVRVVVLGRRAEEAVAVELNGGLSVSMGMTTRGMDVSVPLGMGISVGNVETEELLGGAVTGTEDGGVKKEGGMKEDLNPEVNAGLLVGVVGSTLGSGRKVNVMVTGPVDAVRVAVLVKPSEVAWLAGEETTGGSEEAGRVSTLEDAGAVETGGCTGATDDRGGSGPRIASASARVTQPTSTISTVFIGRARHLWPPGQSVISKAPPELHVARLPSIHAAWLGVQADSGVRVEYSSL